MKLLSVRDLTVTDHFKGERVRLPDQYVRLSMHFDEFSALEQDRSDWLLEQATATQFEEASGNLNFFLRCEEPLPKFLGSFSYQDFATNHLWSFLQIEQRQPFIVRDREAFDLLTLLYTGLGKAVRNGGKWSYTPGEKWELEYLPDRWCLAVRVPEEIQRIAIGRRGDTVARVEHYTEVLKFRLSFRD